MVIGVRCQEVKAKTLKPQSLLNTETLVIVIYDLKFFIPPVLQIGLSFLPVTRQVMTRPEEPDIQS